MVNPFTATGYDMVAMSAAIAKLPNMYSRVTPLFPEGPINTTSVVVEQMNGSLNIIRSRPRGAPADKSIADKRALRSFVVPHIPVTDVITPDEIQGVRAFGSENATETQAGVMARKLQKMKNQLDQTREYLSIGALKGIIYDADATVLYNLYDEFGITAASNAGDVGKYLTLSFALTTDTTDVRAKCLSVYRHIEANLRGTTMTGVRCLCGSTFFDDLTAHPEVEKAFAMYQALGQDLAQDRRRGFRFGGIVFEEYAGNWTDKDANARLGITATSGICFPEGTDAFETVVAPGNFMEAVNTMGIPYYAKQEVEEFGRGVKLWAESNILPICKRPEVLVTVTVS